MIGVARTRLRHSRGRALTWASIVATMLVVMPGTTIGKTLNQVSFVLGPISTPKVTRAYTVNNDSISRYLFYRLGGGASFEYFDTEISQTRKAAFFVDPVWSRIIYAVEGDPIRETTYFSSGTDLFSHPEHLDLAPNGNVFVADTGNNRVVVYNYAAYTGPNVPPRKLYPMIQINGETAFSSPTKVHWEDNGTPNVSTDDILWVLDSESARLAAYHILYNGSTYYASPYIFLGMGTLGAGNHPSRPVAFTKMRSFSAPNQGASYCTEKLCVYDAANNRFVIYTVARDGGFISGAMIPFLVSWQAVPNPVPGTSYSDLVSDAWGNLLAVDRIGSRIIKFDSNLVPIESYGSPGTGPLGSEQMTDPVSLSFHRINGVGQATEYSGKGMLCELWGEQSGIQAVSLGVVAKDLSVVKAAGSDSMLISATTTDHSYVWVNIVDPGANNSTLRTLGGYVRAPGRVTVAWDGRRGDGSLAAPCKTYVARFQAIGLYSQPESSLVTASFYYKPARLNQVRVQSNVPGSRFSFDGRDTTVAGTFAVYPCSLCTVHSPHAPATQTISGVHYCFDRWSNGGYRAYHDIQVRGDSTVTLYLTSGPGPTWVGADSTLYDDAYDCKSPYRFLGSATLTTSSPTDTFRTWGNVKFRFPKVVGTVLNVNRPLIAKGASFETSDSTSNSTVHLWEGIRLGTNASIFLDSCFVRNGEYGITNCSSCTGVANATVTRSSFTANRQIDVALGFDPQRSPTAQFLGNQFFTAKGLNIAVAGSGAALIGSATVINNYFYTSVGGNPELAIQGGWQGEVSGNVFTVGVQNAQGIHLYQSGGASPGVSIRYNQFNILNSGGRVALYAPPTTSVVTQIDALNNNWSYYTSGQIASLITDHTDQSSLATVAYQPWTPSGGGGGGGGGGCPFVLMNGEDGLRVENSILGRSVYDGAPVSDAYPLGGTVPKSEGRIRLRIAEMGSETDEIDALAVGVVDVPDGQKLATDSSGNPVLIATPGTPLRAEKWTGRQSPAQSSVAPGEAFRGEAGDSVEFVLQPGDVAVLQSQGRIGVQLIPKPPLPAGRLGGEPAGITVRISPDTEGDRWFTLPPVIPREFWSTEVLPATGPNGEIARRIRVIWHSQHTLGWIGPVHATPVEPRILPCLGARNSGGRSVLEEVQSRDGQNLTLAPGEYVDLEFDARDAQPTAQYVLLAHGRYYASTLGESAPPVPRVYSLGQNRPNPFNPETAIEFGLPVASHVSLRVYDVAGRLVQTIVQQDLPAGFHVAKWDGRGGHGVPVASGVYFYELRAGSFADRRRMILLR